MVAVVTCAETVMPLNNTRLINTTGKYRDIFFLHFSSSKFVFVRRRDSLNPATFRRSCDLVFIFIASPLAMTFTALRKTGFLNRAITSQDLASAVIRRSREACQRVHGG